MVSAIKWIAINVKADISGSHVTNPKDSGVSWISSSSTNTKYI